MCWLATLVQSARAITDPQVVHFYSWPYLTTHGPWSLLRAYLEGVYHYTNNH